MRIVGGEFGGRRLNPPMKKWPTRPTTDFAKEALFNILHHQYDFNELKVLDLFGGTGSISFEFASRGAHQVTYVEKYGPAVKWVNSIVKEWNIDCLHTIKTDVFKYLGTTNDKYNIVFADPPYRLSSIKMLPDHILERNIIEKNGVLIIEHDEFTNFSNHHPKHSFSRHYGGCYFSFFNP